MGSLMYPLVSPESLKAFADSIEHGIQFVFECAKPEDYFLLPVLILTGSYIYNQGSILPKRPNAYAYKLFEKPQEILNGAFVPQQKNTRNVAERMKQVGADLAIFWGSQSGVAEGFAHRLAREFKHRLVLNALVADLSDYDPDTVAQIPHHKISIFVMSTYGEGDASDNAQEFVSWLRSGKCGRASLSDLRFAAFGCGNRNYRFFNKVIADVVEVLESFGATPLVPTGLGDEAAHTTEEDFLEWKETLLTVVKRELNLEEHQMGYEAGVDVLEIERIEPADADREAILLARRSEKSAPVVVAPLTMRRIIASYGESNRSCVHVDIDLSSHRELKYKTGDHIAVWPANRVEDVNELLHVLDLFAKKDATIQISPRIAGNEDTLKVPSLITLKELFELHLEICAPVSRETVLLLAQLAPTEKVRSELCCIAKDKTAYTAFLGSNYLTLSRLLTYTMTIDPSVPSWSTLPLSFVIDALPPMKPRTYSISSSPVVSPKVVSLTVSVKPSSLVSRPDISIPGLASTLLSKAPSMASNLRMDDISTAGLGICIQIRPSTFKLPFNIKVPVIMVAAGTGIAPFRAFILERAHLASVGRQVGPMTLFFGCQGTDDYLYHEQLVELQCGPLKDKLELVVAFSRSRDHSREYVHKKVASRGPDLCRLLLEDDASFYICGAATMAKSVRDVVREEVSRAKGWTNDEAEEWRLDRKKDNRWFEDVWS